MAPWLRARTALVKDSSLDLGPSIISGGSQPHGAPAPGHLMPVTSVDSYTYVHTRICTHMRALFLSHAHKHTHVHTHIIKVINFKLKKQNRGKRRTETD